MVEQAIRKSAVLALLREHKPTMAERFGVVELALFGSTIRDEARPDSDVDILVSFDRPTDRPGVLLRRPVLHRGPAWQARRPRHGQGVAGRAAPVRRGRGGSCLRADPRTCTYATCRKPVRGFSRSRTGWIRRRSWRTRAPTMRPCTSLARAAVEAAGLTASDLDGGTQGEADHATDWTRRPHSDSSRCSTAHAECPLPGAPDDRPRYDSADGR